MGMLCKLIMIINMIIIKLIDMLEDLLQSCVVINSTIIKSRMPPLSRLGDLKKMVFLIT